MVSPPRDFTTLTDEELVVRFQHGDKAAFEELFQRYNQPLCTYLGRIMADDDLGCDIAQDTFVDKVFKKLPYEKITDFKPWLYRVATNLAIDKLRRINRWRWIPWHTCENENPPRELSLDGPEQHVEEAEEQAVVRKAWKQVSAKYRPCLYFDIIEDKNQWEIADELGISERTVRRYIYKGKEQFARAYHHLVNGQDATENKRGVQ